MMLAAALAIVAALPAQVQLRGEEVAPPGQIVAVDEAGVYLGASPRTVTMAIGWDRVRAIDGGMPAEFAGIADAAWRARTRVERGDFVAAEPLLEELAERYRNQRGPTAAVVAECLARCRLRRGAHVAAIEPWLALLRTRGGEQPPFLHADWSGEAGLPPIMDEATGLIPALPPIWLSWPSVDAFAGDVAGASGAGGARSNAPADSRAAWLMQIYVQAARYEAGQPAALPELATSDRGVGIAWEIVQARIGSVQEREAARQLLRKRLEIRSDPASEPSPPWLEAWLRAGLGRSLVREQGTQQKQTGVIELLQVPARFSGSHPYLSGLMLAEASVVLRSIGDHDGADVLAGEFEAAYPTHPAHDWAPFREFRPRTHGRAAGAARAAPGPGEQSGGAGALIR